MVELLRDWFANNRPLVLFVYGQIFFILGVSILLQSRQYSRLILARSLPWLAGFGILHGLEEWGDIFIPIQLETLGSGFSILLDIIQLIVLALSFASLFQFGIELLRPFSPKFRWVRIIPSVFLITWGVLPFWLGFILVGDIQMWSNYANAVARYMLCVPACLVTVVGLFHQVRLQIVPMKIPHIGRMLKLSATALLVYGLVEILSVPKGFFFPATVINGESFTNAMIIPPYVFRSLAGLVLVYAMLHAQQVFNIETDRMIRRMEEGQVVATERDRIARDLHDGALQQVYASGLMAQSLKRHVDESTGKEVDRLILTINQAIEQLRGFLPHTQGDLKSVDLVGALTPVIEDARRNISVDTFWDTQELPSLSPDQTRHLTAFVSEALSNVIRHAKSEKAEVRLFCKKRRLNLQVRDFGQGIPSSTDPGFGLGNMRDRARLLGAELRFDTEKGKGTSVTLELPMEKTDDTHPLADC
ncbi:MAG: histidine kinase [Chloroflexi bacterium]|nr:histidine kinase [Chloroflexota bacterium]